MRLDLFLKISRLIPRRSLAQEFCDEGMIFVNEAPAKSSKEIRSGDVIEVKRPNRVTRVRILQVPATKQVSKNSAGELYELMEETALENDSLNLGFP